MSEPGETTTISVPPPSNARARSVMRGNRRRDTNPELEVRSALHRQGLRFRVDHVIRAAGTRVRPDIVFSKRRVAVFIDGCFWHGCPEHFVASKSNVAFWEQKLARNVARDRANDAALCSDGWTVVRCWAHEPVAEIVEQVRRALSELGGAEDARRSPHAPLQPGKLKGFPD